jgi:hypothetical protein
VVRAAAVSALAMFQRVVADPGLEEVAEDVERVGAGDGPGEEALEARGDFRPRRLEVQVGDEERAALQTRSAFSITTGCTGTFWCPPVVAVWTLRIWSTTSMPSTTLPNTA